MGGEKRKGGLDQLRRAHGVGREDCRARLDAPYCVKGRMNADVSRTNLRGRGNLPRGMGAKMRGGVVMSIFCGDAPSADMKELSSVTSAQEGSLTTRATIAFSGALHSICADRRFQDVTDSARIPPFGQSSWIRVGGGTKSIKGWKCGRVLFSPPPPPPSSSFSSSMHLNTTRPERHAIHGY